VKTANGEDQGILGKVIVRVGFWGREDSMCLYLFGGRLLEEVRYCYGTISSYNCRTRALSTIGVSGIPTG